MKKFKINENNKKTIISIIIFIVVSLALGGYYLFAYADEEDAFANDLYVSGSNITEIRDETDGSFNDITDNNGNDSSINNNVVRTFDKVSYQVPYNLLVKENNDSTPDTTGNDNNDDTTQGENGNGESGSTDGETTPTDGDNTGTNTDDDPQVTEPSQEPSTEPAIGEIKDRDIIVDVLFPDSVSGVVKSGDIYYDLIDVFGNYKYAEFPVKGNYGDNTFNFTLDNIYAQNGTRFNPIIFIKESTDNNKKTIL